MTVLQYTDTAKEQLDNLPISLREKIEKAFERLLENPESEGQSTLNIKDRVLLSETEVSALAWLSLTVGIVTVVEVWPESFR